VAFDMIINISHTKGGVGKTMIATNLSISLVAPIVDLDIQQSSSRFFQLREQEGLNRLPVYIELTEELIAEYKGNKKKHLIIDSGGMDNNSIRQGLIVSDMIISPVAISQVEIFGLQDFNELLNSAGEVIDRNKTFVLLNNVNKQAKREIQHIKELISSEFDFVLLNTILGTRKAYKDAYSFGQSVVELAPQSPASDEIVNLTNEIRQYIERIK
jgi:chromosome partitioning protein